MQLSRRTMLSGAAASSALALFPQRTIGQLALGSGSLTTVSDGNLVLPGNVAFDSPELQDLLPQLVDMGLSPDQVEPECNLALYRDGTNTVLFDAGSGHDFMPSAGKILDSLDAIGVAPDDITHVIMTHAHPDHVWGLLDDFDDPMFYNAVHMMGQREWDYWWNPETVDTIGEARTTFAVGAKRRMEALEDAFTLFTDGQEVVPGVLAIETPGHTPGHMSFEVRQGNDAVMVLGDAIGNHHVAFLRPDLHSPSDQDPTQGAATRVGLFDRITNERLLVAGFHLPQGGIGRIENGGDGAYRFLQGDL